MSAGETNDETTSGTTGRAADETAEETAAVTTEITETDGAGAGPDPVETTESDPAAVAEAEADVAEAEADVAEADVTDVTEVDVADVADVAESDVDDDADDLVAASEASEAPQEATEEAQETAAATKTGRRIDLSRVFAFGVLPVLALLLAAAAAYLKWEDAKVRDSDVARAESLQVAKDSTIRLLSYKPDTVEQELTSARDLLTGSFRDSYTQLTNDVVIPGAKEKQIAALANVPAVASISATPSQAVALVFVNQTTTIGNDAPTSTNSSVKVTLDKVGDRWLISEFDPV